MLVVVQHSAERSSRAYQHWTSTWLQVGQLGVTVFFLVSGLVVPVSLERARGLRRFWVARIARLYPAYWLSLLGFVYVNHLGHHPYPAAFRARPVHSWLVESGMVQAFLNVPDLFGVYWTLAFELTFYVLVSLAFAASWLRHSASLAYAALAGACAVSLLGRATGHHTPLGLANIATMFVGTVLWRMREGAVAPRTAWTVYAAGLVGGQVVLAAGLAGRGIDTSTADAATWRADALAWLVAYALVAVAVVVAGRDRLRVPRVLVLVGLVSYSTYLIHPIVLDARSPVHEPAAVTVLVTLVLTLALATVSYRMVERPAVRLGRALGRRLPRDG